MSPLKRLVVALAVSTTFAASAHAQSFPLAEQGKLPTLIHADHVTMRHAAGMLGRDLAALSGLKPVSSTKLDDCATRCIVVGPHDAAVVQEAARALGVKLDKLKGEKERYLRVAGKAKGRDILLIAGADARGAIYGVVDMTRELGISPWEWWADVAPAKPANPASLAVDGAERLSPAPSVEFRGIFLNDEDWGLQPWAAKIDPAKDLGPTAYGHIYELMWRLKANLLWPAMHPSTKAFYKIPGNGQMAADYAIVIGTSHAEPMLRNNVDEWKKEGKGAFNIFTNRDNVLDYWQKRLDEAKHFSNENIFTLGMRGVHDSAMEGVKDATHGRDTVTDVIGIQRGMMSKTLGKPATQIPQVLTVYKEVLDYYNAGLKLPDDVTLVWPDDNYGYLHQLSTPKERARSGGSGIYYHLSYWGRPHDYLWLGTTHPALIRDQLERAWATGTRKVWVANVGDIKPAEYLTQYFLDAAFDASVLKQDPARHLERWAAQQFGAGNAQEVAAIMQEFYSLAWERRPEFMGWSETEPTRATRTTGYMASGGEEAELRLERYRRITERAEALSQRLPAALRDAFFQLVLYPVRGAASLNTRILKLDLATEYGRQQRPAANLYVQQARAAHAVLVADTATYNALAGGKWSGMMDMAPRRLPVFAEPAFPSWAASARRGCGVVYPTPQAVDADRIVLRQGQPDTRTVTLVSYGEQAAAWSLREGGSGIRVEQKGGQLNAGNGYEQRIALHYDGSAKPSVSFQCGERTINIALRADAPKPGVATERERIIVMAGGAATGASPDWQVQPGLGGSGQAVRASFELAPRKADSLAGARPLEYSFVSSTEGGAELRFVAVPVHALTSEHGLRIAVSLDGGPVEVFDYTTFGRSDEWKANVLSNAAVRSKTVAQLKAGAHTLRVWALDPGVVLDRIEVALDGAPRYYGLPAQK